MSITQHAETQAFTDPDTPLAAALELAGHGFNIFPLEPGTKEPAIVGYPRKATTDREKVRRWWECPITGWHQDYNIAILTGNGLVAVDVDNKGEKQGSATLAERYRDLPATLTGATPTGGLHLIYRTSDAVRNSAGKLGPGLDVRGHHGFIVAPGSVVEAGAYRWVEGRSPADLEPAELPSVIRERLYLVDRKPANQDRTPAVELDTDSAIARAVAFLEAGQGVARPVHEGERNNHAFPVASQLKDFGISEGRTAELMLDHWQCEPMLDFDELERTIASAFKHGAPGRDHPAADFEPVYSGLEPRPAPLVEELDEKDLPTRPWIAKGLALRGTLSVLIAPGGAGKSSLTLVLALAVVSGRDDVIRYFPIAQRCPVWYFNREDRDREMRLRLRAAMDVCGIVRSDLEIDGKRALFINHDPPKIAKRNRTGALVAGDVAEIKDHIRRHGIGLLMVDPLTGTHDANENDNIEMDKVARLYEEIATDTGCAVLVIHHTRKPPTGTNDSHVGNQDSGRGASALIDAARIAYTLYGPKGDDKKQYPEINVAPNRYVRLDSAKANSVLRERHDWFYRETITFVNGEEVGALKPVQLERKITNTRVPVKEAFLRALGAVLQNDPKIRLHAHKNTPNSYVHTVLSMHAAHNGLGVFQPDEFEKILPQLEKEGLVNSEMAYRNKGNEKKHCVAPTEKGWAQIKALEEPTAGTPNEARSTDSVFE